MTMQRPELRLIDVMIDELESPRDHGTVPDNVLDQDVVPWAMVEYLRRTDRFPIAPTLVLENGRLLPTLGGRWIWAANQVKWTKPIRCVILWDRSKTAPLLSRTRPFSQEAAVSLDEESQFTLQVQVLCFSRTLSHSEKQLVESELIKLSKLSIKKGQVSFSQIHDLSWESDKILAWKSLLTSNPEDQSMTSEWSSTLSNIHQLIAPIEAWNGRCFYGTVDRQSI